MRRFKLQRHHSYFLGGFLSGFVYFFVLFVIGFMLGKGAL
jgi:hypothetical protein